MKYRDREYLDAVDKANVINMLYGSVAISATPAGGISVMPPVHYGGKPEEFYRDLRTTPEATVVICSPVS